MNPESILNLAVEAIVNRTCDQKAPCWLGFEDGDILCLPMYNEHSNFKSLIYIATFELNNGFSTKRWKEIGSKLYKYWKENCECQKSPTH